MPSWGPILLGVIAGCFSIYAFVPQVLKIWRDGDTHAISLRMYVLRVSGFGLWLWYGVLIGSAPVIVFNILSLILGGTVLVLKARGSAASLAPDHGQA